MVSGQLSFGAEGVL